MQFVLPLPYEQLLRCSPLVTNYFIKVINAVSNASILITTNQTAFMLNDVRVGDVYLVEVVPSSAVGNGSAASTTISENRERYRMSFLQLLQLAFIFQRYS